MKLLKNPIFWGFVLFLGGMIVGGIGWDRHDSTLPWRTQGSTTIIVIGVVMIVAGIAIFFTKGNRK